MYEKFLFSKGSQAAHTSFIDLLDKVVVYNAMALKRLAESVKFVGSISKLKTLSTSDFRTKVAI